MKLNSQNIPKPSLGRTGTGYRPDIDGLRAVAVILVVLDHLGLPMFSGGYIGVDVFLVISGYLITGLILAEVADGTFSFTQFYARRAKRLLPALCVMIGVVILFGYYLLLPADFSLLAQSALSALALGSNVFFWWNSGGYFSPDAAAFPLLHVWSLSLEEQFYLLWPAAALLLLYKTSLRTLKLSTIVLIVMSFALAQYAVSRDWTGAYFLLPTRAGEFMLGAILVIWQKDGPTARGSVLSNLASSLGLLLILMPAVLLDEASAFPGINALAPCVGALLVIAAPRWGGSVVTRLLSTRGAIGLGLISYSVYLWHWPIIAYTAYAGIELTPPIAAAALSASLVAGYFSWRFVEVRWRVLLTGSSNWALSISLLWVVALVTGSLWIVGQAGMPQRFPFTLLTQDQLQEERARYWHELPGKRSTFSDDESLRQTFIIGDSHAYDLAYALSENKLEGELKLMDTYAECYNFGHDAIAAQHKAACAELLETVLARPELRVADAVYLHDHWGKLDLISLSQMLQKLRAITAVPIYVFGPKMIFNEDVLSISKNAQRDHHTTTTSINRYAQSLQTTQRMQMDEALAAFFIEPPIENIEYISWIDVQCGEKRICNILSDDGNYLYFDADHFTLLGAQQFGARLKRLKPQLF